MPTAGFWGLGVVILVINIVALVFNSRALRLRNNWMILLHTSTEELLNGVVWGPTALVLPGGLLNMTKWPYSRQKLQKISVMFEVLPVLFFMAY